MVNWIITRLKEPSTYAGFSGLAIAFGLSTELYTALSTAIAGVAAVIAVILSEKVTAE